LKALEEVAQEVLPAGMGYDYAGLSYQEKKASGQAGPIFALSLTCVFLILAALYESWSLPFSVLLTTPVAMLGAFLGLKGRAFDFDVYGQIGMIMLVGLAAKNAILIVEFAKIRFDKGEALVESALEGARLRFFGCVPLWIAQGAGAGGRQILGTTVISGMLTATLIGIFLVPVLFVVVERLSQSRKQAGAPAATQPARGDD
jgi:HAE1 family hydrophobic/amphiphilic exporter-1